MLIISHLPLVFDLVLELTNHQHHVHFYPAVIAEVKWQPHKSQLVLAQHP